MSVPFAVADASVGVKWFCDEPGTVDALQLLEDHIAGRVRLAVDALFVYEVIAVVQRKRGRDRAGQAFSALTGVRLQVADPSAALVDRALEVQHHLGCAFYDATAPALAELLGARLYSADVRAHRDVPGVVLVGQSR